VARTASRPEAANDGWQKIWDFFGGYLAGPTASSPSPAS
jgi:hypothetical protein